MKPRSMKYAWVDPASPCVVYKYGDLINHADPYPGYREQTVHFGDSVEYCVYSDLIYGDHYVLGRVLEIAESGLLTIEASFPEGSETMPDVGFSPVPKTGTWRFVQAATAPVTGGFSRGSCYAVGA